MEASTILLLAGILALVLVVVDITRRARRRRARRMERARQALYSHQQMQRALRASAASEQKAREDYERSGESRRRQESFEYNVKRTTGTSVSKPASLGYTPPPRKRKPEPVEEEEDVVIYNPASMPLEVLLPDYGSSRESAPSEPSSNAFEGASASSESSADIGSDGGGDFGGGGATDSW